MNPSPCTIRAAAVLKALRAQRPLVLCLTNSVVQQISANLLLAVGAVPAMLAHAGEADDMLHACADALLINVGTLDENQARLMRSAVRSAQNSGTPWALDPVAAGLLRFRTAVCNELLETPPGLIRGNASEILALAGASAAACRGPESGAESSAAIDAARQLARDTGAAVLVTGETDYATDGRQVIACRNGHPLMTRVTGIGCAMGGLAAACLAVAPSALDAAAAAAAILGVAGERAAARSPRPGGFAASLLDELDRLEPIDVEQFALLAPETDSDERNNLINRARMIDIVPYGPEYAQAWRELNEEWIRRFFSIEPRDVELLGDPQRYVIDAGGRIFVALLNGTPIGVASLEPVGRNEFELSKLAVTPKAQGLGAGRRLCEAVIAAARAAGASSLRIETNTRLPQALRLYRSLGFRQIPNAAPRYNRVDIQFELPLK